MVIRAMAAEDADAVAELVRQLGYGRTPEQIAGNELSHTGYWLARALAARRESANEVVA